MVSEEQYAAWQDTGVVPPATADDSRPDDGELSEDTSTGDLAETGGLAETGDEPADDPSAARTDRADATGARPADRDS